MSWSFHNPTRVRFGRGCRAALVDAVADGPLLLVSTRRGRAQFEADPVLGPLAHRPDAVWVDTVQPNPGLQDTQAEIDRLQGQNFTQAIAFGGGSALDATKALSVGLAANAPTRDLRALISEPQHQAGLKAIPLLAVPTTSGTGSEVTSFATIWDHANKKKLSLAGPAVVPHSAFVDPELTDDLPAAATFGTGLDALNQALESVWNRNASLVTLGLAAQAVARAFDALPRLHASLADKEARNAIAEASLLAGLCISQTRTAICHSTSYPITAHFDVAHGFACAFTMGAVARLAAAHDPERLNRVARLAGLSDHAELLRRLEAVLDLLDVRASVRKKVPDLQSLLALKGEMHTPGRADNFIVPMQPDTLDNILQASFG